MKPYSGSIRHDYKDSPNEASETPKRHCSWFLFGLSLPLLVVTLFLVTENDESGVVPILGIPETTAWHDRQGRPHYLYRGQPISELF